MMRVAEHILPRLPTTDDNAAMEAEPLNAPPPKRKRRWFQFSLRTLMIFTLICAVAAGWLGRKIEQKRREREVVVAIHALGGAVNFDYQRTTGSRPSWVLRGEPYGAVWLRTILGENFFSEIEFVGLQPRPGSKDEAVDAVFESLREMKHLQFLFLAGSKVNDDRLATLTALTQLQGLELAKTQVSEAAIERLKRALPNCKIEHENTNRH